MIATFLILASACNAQTYTSNGFTFTQAHPRLWFPAGSARLTQAKAWAAANPITCIANDYMCVAFEHATTNSDCSAAITWAANTNQSSPVAQRGGAGAWPPTAGETSSGTAGANDMRWNAETVYLVFDWCYDQWSSGQKSAFVTANQGWLTTVDQQCWGGVIGGPNSCTANMYQSNFYIGYTRNDLEFGIATYGDNGTGGGSAADNDIVSGINRWENFVTAYTSPGMQGGIPQEGTEYGVSFWYLILPFETIELGGRDIINECDFLRQLVAYWTVYSATPAITQSALAGRTSTYAQFDYSDNEVTQSHNAVFDISGNNNLYWQDFWNFGSNFWNGTGNTGQLIRLIYNQITGYAATGTNYSLAADHYFLAVDNAPSPAANFSALPLDYYSPGFPYAFSKTAWDTTSTEVMLQMAHINSNVTGDHIHSDDGSFTMWRGGYWVDRETTGYSQILSGSSAFQSNANQGTASQFAHNTLVFTNPELDQIDPGSLPGIQFGFPTVYRVQSQPGYFYVDVDLTNNYLWDSGHAPSYQTGVVGHVEREFVYVRSLETLVVFDRILTQNQTNLGSLTASQVVTTFMNHCETNPTVVDSQHFQCVDVAQDAEQTVLIPTSATYRVINEDTCTGCTGSPLGQYRIEIDNSGAAQRYNLDVIQAYPNSGGCPLVAANTDSNSGNPGSGTFTVTLTPESGGGCSTPGTATTIVFTKATCSSGAGQCSTGGTINVAGGGVTSLLTTIEPITYTNNGPVWGNVVPPPPAPARAFFAASGGLRMK